MGTAFESPPDPVAKARLSRKTSPTGHVLQRLRSKAQFQAAMAGPPVAKTPHFALHRTSLEARSGDICLFPVQDTWLGVLIPKRWARRAVTRNTIRRQIYEVARLHALGLPQAGLVVRLRAEFSRKQFVSATSTVLKQAVRQELVALLGRLGPRPVAVTPLPAQDEVPHVG